MPLPSPKGDQAKDNFISNCMGDSVMNKEFSNSELRAAVCYNKWRKSKGTTEIDLFESACPECKCMPCVCGSRSVEEVAKHKSGYPGENVKRRKDGVPQKKKKKRATKKGEYRGKDGKLKKK